MSYTNQLRAPTAVPIASALSCRDTNDSKWSWTMGSEIGGAFDPTRAQNRIACLPNRFSYTEAIQRRLGHTAHDRLYTLGSARRLLADAGFTVVASRPHFLLPTMLNGFPPRFKAAYERAHRVVWSANRVLERLWPLNRLASNLLLVARRPGGA